MESAMQQFWAKGYHDTSIRDLVTATGVNQYGLYSAFGDKHGMMMAALDRYVSIVTNDVLNAIRRPGPLPATLRRAYNTLLRHIAQDPGKLGCMMCNAAIELAPYDRHTSAKVGAHMRRLQDAFADRILDAQGKGEISGDRSADQLAEFLTATAYTLGVLARSGERMARLKRHVDTAINAVR